MDGVLKSLSIGHLLRSVFAGSFFVLSYVVAGNGSNSLLQVHSSQALSSALLVALVSGVTVYGLHRALAYPMVEQIMNSPWAQSIRAKWPLISDATVTVLKDLWTLASEPGKEKQERAKHAVLWADYIHLQYVSALCIGSGTLVRVVTEPGQYTPHWPFLFLAALFTTAALVSDWRLHRVREAFENAS